jgi:hypothetical protein
MQVMLALLPGKRPGLRAFRVCFSKCSFSDRIIRLREHFSIARILALIRWARRRPRALRANTARARGAAEAWKMIRNARAAKDFPEFLQPVIEWPPQRTFGEHGGGPGAVPGRHGANFRRVRGHRRRCMPLN